MTEISEDAFLNAFSAASSSNETQGEHNTLGKKFPFDYDSSSAERIYFPPVVHEEHVGLSLAFC